MCNNTCVYVNTFLVKNVKFYVNFTSTSVSIENFTCHDFVCARSIIYINQV